MEGSGRDRPATVDRGPGLGDGAKPRSRFERQGGNGHSDVVRLSTRSKPSKGVNALRGSRRPLVAAGVKRSEPQVRHQAATRLEPAHRSKPSKRRETARTERDIGGWQPRSEGSPRGSGSGRARVRRRRGGSRTPWEAGFSVFFGTNPGLPSRSGRLEDEARGRAPVHRSHDR
jgi:hypothetical protein